MDQPTADVGKNPDTSIYFFVVLSVEVCFIGGLVLASKMRLELKHIAFNVPSPLSETMKLSP